jgi:hypothetical protein
VISTDVEETVTLEMCYLVYLKVKAYCFHCCMF